MLLFGYGVVPLSNRLFTLGPLRISRRFGEVGTVATCVKRVSSHSMGIGIVTQALSIHYQDNLNVKMVYIR